MIVTWVARNIWMARNIGRRRVILRATEAELEPRPAAIGGSMCRNISAQEGDENGLNEDCVGDGSTHQAPKEAPDCTFFSCHPEAHG
jgi:hypothetical protein